jgi:vacuolar-type H+-ATPase subunit I/STV1
MSDNPTITLPDLAPDLANVAATAGAAPTDKVERIRELLFGTQNREYVRRFTSLEHSFTQSQQQLQQQLQRLSEQLRAQEEQTAQQLQILAQKQAEQVAAVEQQLRAIQAAVLAELRDASGQLDRAKVDRAALGTLFAELATTLQASVATATPSVTDWLTQLEEQLQ